ncbi:MAG: carboxypeptidase-like regulatory domain-containing protein [Chitinophagales bacterium]
MNFHKRLLVLLIALFFSANCFAQKAHISGKVTEKTAANEEAVPFATVSIAGTTLGSTTDFDGAYSIEVDAGTHRVVFSFVGFKPDTLNITVAEGQNLTLNHALSQENIQIETVTVKEKANRESQTMNLIDRKNATALTQNIGAKELSKKGVSNVVEGLKKVAGISVIGNKYFLVRGMDDRYNNALLNGLPIASPDPDKKVIPLDIFPTDIVENLSIFKSYSPQYYGDVAGGTVAIKTKEYPSTKTLKLGIGAGFNSVTTGKNFLSSPSISGSYLGFSKDGRQAPASISDIASYDSRRDGLSFDNSSNGVYKKAPVSNSFDLLFGNFFSTGNDSGLGVLLSVAYDNDYSIKEGMYRLVNRQGDIRIDYDYINYSFSTNTSALASMTYKFNDRHKITLNGILVNSSSDNSRDAYGNHFDYSSPLFSRRFTYNQNTLLTGQLGGTHDLLKGNRLKLNWSQTYNVAKSEEPDRRQFVFLDTDNKGRIFNDIDVNENHRFYSNLEETEMASKVEAVYDVIQYEGTDKAKLQVTLGGNLKSKERDFDYRQFNYNLKNFDQGGLDVDAVDTYLSQSNHSDGAFYLDERDDPASANTSKLDVWAAYFLGDYDLIPNRLKLLAGARYESAEQSIEFKNQQQPSITEKPTLNEAYLLPSLSFKFTPSEKQVWWLTASQTISRPGFKELAPFEYVEFFAGERTIGNPLLQNGKNYNFDLRYELYPTRGELVSISAFGKYLQDPIERLNIAASSGRLQSFTNIESATLAGVELELSKKLNFLSSEDFTNTWTAGLNATYLYSQIKINEANKLLLPQGEVSVVVTNPDRALQGASPYLVNFDLSYQKRSEKWNTNATLVYNVFGKRIHSVGVKAPNSDGGLGDIYELPVHRLDLIVKNELNKNIGIDLSVKNLLNPSTRLQQDTDAGTIELDNYKTGISAGIKLSYNF